MVCMAEHLRLLPPLRPTSGIAQVDGASADEVSTDCSELLNGADRSGVLARREPSTCQRCATGGIYPGRCVAFLSIPHMGSAVPKRLYPARQRVLRGIDLQVGRATSSKSPSSINSNRNLSFEKAAPSCPYTGHRRFATSPVGMYIRGSIFISRLYTDTSRNGGSHGYTTSHRRPE